jgi:hypothetical protein
MMNRIGMALVGLAALAMLVAVVGHAARDFYGIRGDDALGHDRDAPGVLARGPRLNPETIRLYGRWDSSVDWARMEFSGRYADAVRDRAGAAPRLPDGTRQGFDGVVLPGSSPLNIESVGVHFDTGSGIYRTAADGLCRLVLNSEVRATWPCREGFAPTGLGP